MSEFYVGDIMLYPTAWPPQDFLPCDGRSLQIKDYLALHAVIGTTYGGDGTTYFNLPDLRGRTPVGSPAYLDAKAPADVGKTAGLEKVTLTTENLPPHIHTVEGPFSLTFNASLSPATNAVPGEGDMLAQPTNGAGADVALYSYQSEPDVVIQSNSSGTGKMTAEPTGRGQPINNMQPFLVMNFYICVNGLFPQHPT